MTEQQKEQISELRATGMSYAVIAKETGMAASSIKSFCQRNKLGGVRSAVGRGALPDVCEQCGKPLRQQKGRKHKRFCSDSCRMLWWSKHRELVQQKTLHSFICSTCGKRFERYGVRERHFCSRKCYAEYRSEVKA